MYETGLLGLTSLKFPVVDKLTEANCDFKKFGFPKCVGRGGGSTIPIQVKISCLKIIKTVITLIYSQLFCCMVSIINILIFILMKNSLRFILYRFYTEL